MSGCPLKESTELDQWLERDLGGSRRICTFGGRLVASPAYLALHGAPQTLEDLAQHQAVAQKGEVWRMRDGRRTITVRPRGRFFADNGEALLAAALAGVGVAALPDFLTGPHVAAGTLVPLLTNYPAPEAGMFVVHPSGAFPSRKVRILIDLLVEHFADSRPSGKGSLTEPL